MPVLFFHNKNFFCRLSSLLLFAASIHLPVLAQMSQRPVTLAKEPLPNVLFIFDNSSSMGLTYTSFTPPEAMMQMLNDPSHYSASFNKLYYNPDITYHPALAPNGTSMGNIPINHVTPNPFTSYMQTAQVGSVLSSAIRITKRCGLKDRSHKPLPTYKTIHYDDIAMVKNPNCQSTDVPAENKHATYAFYYKWIKSGEEPDGSHQQKTDTYYERVDILPEKAPFTKSLISQRIDCNHKDYCTYNEEIQNFANWFAYYRSRLNTAKTVIGHVINDFENKMNLGLTSINNNTSNGNTNNTTAWGFIPIQPLSALHKKTWLETLYGNGMQGNTPLREALYRGGQYFKTGTMEGASNTPDPVQHTCQRNYIILSTDGAWTDSDNNPRANNPDHIGNLDTIVPKLPANIDHDPISRSPLTEGKNFPPPFFDQKHSKNTLADIAMHFWSNKLRSNSSLTMTPTDRDPAPWQHVSTYALGMAIDGTLKYQPDYETAPTGDYRDILDGTKNWLNPIKILETGINSSELSELISKRRVDDLWHTAVNGHGKYLSVKSPEALKHAMTEILTDITSQPSAGARIAQGSTFQNEAYSYVASYHSKNWTGHLKAYRQTIATGLGSQLVWDAAQNIPPHNERNIFTSNRGNIIAFQWNKLPQTTKNKLTPEAVKYLRGDKTHENGTEPHRFRKRESPLGDIVNSHPLYTHAHNFHYDKLPSTQDGSDYLAFLEYKKNRHPLLFVGANDGMIHIFDAKTGEEKMAYVPEAIHDDLLELTKPSYSHQFYVDGPIVDGDVQFKNKDKGKWQNIVVVSNGAGKPGLTAFNATNTEPNSFTQNMILWEVNPKKPKFAHLGHIMGEPSIGKLPSGDWAVITGNGYFGNESALYLINTEDGTLIKKIQVSGTTGLSAPAVIYNTQREIIGAYAGDLGGNLWKFDLSSNQKENWGAIKLFATGTSAQPIVQKPYITTHRKGGYMIVFGTGKLFEKNDDTNTQPQTLYGVWDKRDHPQTITPQELQEHTLTEKTNGRVINTTTLNGVHHLGWKIPLPNSGERMIGNFLQINSEAIVTTTIAPNTHFCTPTGGSWLLAIDPITGLEPKKFYFVNETTTLLDNTHKISGIKLIGATSGVTRIPSPGDDCLALNQLNSATSCIPFREPKEILRRWRLIPNTMH